MRATVVVVARRETHAGDKQDKRQKSTPRGNHRRSFLLPPLVSLTLSLLHFTTSSIPIPPHTMATKTERAAFEAVFPSLAQDLLDHAKKYNLPENAMQWFEKVGPTPLTPRAQTIEPSNQHQS